MDRWYKLSQSAAKLALKFRLEKGLGLESPCDIYELVHALKLELQFMDVPSLEGMCLQEEEVTRLCVTAHRPWGRQRYTAAHELGHYVLKHGTRLDQMMESWEEQNNISNDEILADAFARFLLMPPRAVGKAFQGNPAYNPSAVFRASCWLGVGYESLIRQMQASLRMITDQNAKNLIAKGRQEIVRELAHDPTFSSDLWLLDKNWRDRLLHVQVGDLIIGAKQTEVGILEPSGSGLLARTPGQATVELIDGGTTRVLLSRRNYVGFYDYRYLPE